MKTELLRSNWDKFLYEKIFNEINLLEDWFDRLFISSYNSNIFVIIDFLKKLNYKKGKIIVLLWSNYLSTHSLKDVIKIKSMTEKLEKFNEIKRNDEYDNIQDLENQIFELNSILQNINGSLYFSHINHSKMISYELDNWNSKAYIWSQNLSRGKNLEVWVLIENNNEYKEFINSLLEDINENSIRWISLMFPKNILDKLDESFKYFEESILNSSFLYKDEKEVFFSLWSFYDFDEIKNLSNEIEKFFDKLDKSIDLFNLTISELRNLEVELSSIERIYSKTYTSNSNFIELKKNILKYLKFISSDYEIILNTFDIIKDDLKTINLNNLFADFNENFIDRINAKVEDWSLTVEEWQDLSNSFYDADGNLDANDIYTNYFIEVDIENYTKNILDACCKINLDNIEKNRIELKEYLCNFFKFIL